MLCPIGTGGSMTSFASKTIGAVAACGLPLLLLIVGLPEASFAAGPTTAPARTPLPPMTRQKVMDFATANMSTKPDEAMTRLRAVLAADPHDVECWVMLIHMLGTYGKGDEADVHARAARQF